MAAAAVGSTWLPPGQICTDRYKDARTPSSRGLADASEGAAEDERDDAAAAQDVGFEPRLHGGRAVDRQGGAATPAQRHRNSPARRERVRRRRDVEDVAGREPQRRRG